MANQQGTGKHGHKDSHEPYPHHTTGHDQNSGESSKHNEGSGNREGGGGQGSSDLKQREYRDKDGNIHHHTHTYEEQHGKKSGEDR